MGGRREKENEGEREKKIVRGRGVEIPNIRYSYHITLSPQPMLEEVAIFDFFFSLSLALFLSLCLVRSLLITWFDVSLSDLLFYCYFGLILWTKRGICGLAHCGSHLFLFGTRNRMQVFTEICAVICLMIGPLLYLFIYGFHGKY